MVHKILIIDDEDIVRESICDTLREEGYEIHVAANGQEGLEKYHQINPSIVILDLRMPVMDGMGFLTALDRSPVDLSSIIVLTGHGGDEDVNRCFELGVNSFLRKPFNIYELTGVVRNLVSLYDAREQLITSYNTQAIINTFLQLSVESANIDQLLDETLDLIMNLPVFTSIQKKGCIFIANPANPDVLVLRAQVGLPPPILEQCSQLPFGKCLCGRAAQQREVITEDRCTDHHDVQYEGMMGHGHHIVPIMAHEEVLGVINLYLDEGHVMTETEKHTLLSISYALANVIDHYRKVDKLSQPIQAAEQQ